MSVSVIESMKKERAESEQKYRELMQRRNMHLRVLADTHADDPVVVKLRKEEATLMLDVKTAAIAAQKLRTRVREIQRAMEERLAKHLPEDLK